MDEQEIEMLVKQLKAQGLKDEEIMDVFYKTFEEGKMDRKDLENLTEAMGFELTDDFKNDEGQDPIDAPAAAEDGEITAEEAEEAKALEPDETAEEFAERVGVEDEGGEAVEEEPEESDEGEEAPETDTPEEDEGESDDDAEWEEVRKKFRV